MRRINYYLQDEQSSCGVYCVAMILDYHGRHENILKLKQAINPHFSGVSVTNMISLLKNYNIEAKAYQAGQVAFLKEANFPCVVLIRNENFDHFVVVFKKNKKTLLIADPAKGKRVVSHDEFGRLFKEVVINIEHVGRYGLKEKNQSLRNFMVANLGHDRFQVARLVGYSMVISLMTLLISYYYNNVFQNYLERHLMMIFSLAIVVVIGLKGFLELLRSFLFLHLQQRLMARIVLKTMENLVYLQPFFYQNLKQGKTIAKINNLYVFCASIASWYTGLSFDLVLVIFLFGTIGLICWELLLVIILAMAIFGWGLFKLLQKLKTVESDFLDDEEVLNETVLELIHNYPSIRQFGQSVFFKKKLNFHYHSFGSNFQEKNQIQIKIGLFGELIINVMAVLLIVVGIWLPFGESYLILLYFLFSLGSRHLMNIVTLIINYPEISNIYAKYQLLIPDKPEPKRKMRQAIATIECCNLKFGYGTKVVFDQFSQKITRSTLICGAIGQGKTTLSRLLCGDLQAQAGEILINGQNMNEYDYKHLKRRMVYLDKQPMFFNESLRFNMLLGSDEEKKMTDLLVLFNQSGLLNFLDFPLGDNFLSAGMAQIVMIVRTLIKGADVVIFDEALSNIDLPTAKVIVDYLEKLDIIVLMITHNTKLMNLCSLYDRIEII